MVILDFYNMLPLSPQTTLPMTSIIGTKKKLTKQKKHQKNILIFILKTINSKQKACLNNLGFKINLLTFQRTKPQLQKL
jgi:hypothetical protein